MSKTDMTQSQRGSISKAHVKAIFEGGQKKGKLFDYSNSIHKKNKLGHYDILNTFTKQASGLHLGDGAHRQTH